MMKKLETADLSTINELAEISNKLSNSDSSIKLKDLIDMIGELSFLVEAAGFDRDTIVTFTANLIMCINDMLDEEETIDA